MRSGASASATFQRIMLEAADAHHDVRGRRTRELVNYRAMAGE